MTGKHCWQIGDGGEFCDRMVEWSITCSKTGNVIYSCDRHVSKFVLNKKDNEHLVVNKLSKEHKPCECVKCTNA
jgi:hypothetical protein